MTAMPVENDDDVICAVDHRTGEVFFTAAYVAQLQRRIAELEAQIEQGTP